MESCNNSRVHPVSVAGHLCVLLWSVVYPESHYSPASEPRDEDGDDDVLTFDDGSWRGNKRGKLWKSACIHGALNVRKTCKLLSAFVNGVNKVEPLRSRASSVCFPSAFIKNLCGIEISMPNVGGFPMGPSEHYV